MFREMTLKELIEKLKELNWDAEIRYMDTEYGNTKIDKIEKELLITFNRPKYWDYEEYEWDLYEYEHRDELDYNILSKREIYVLR